MRPSLNPIPVPLFDRRPHRSSVPTGYRKAAARSGRQGRPSGRRACARLALYGRKHGGILVHFAMPVRALSK
jgi:hypothetical protein